MGKRQLTGEFIADVKAECERARTSKGPLRTPHESLGVLLEEFEEYKDEVKEKKLNKRAAYLELMQVAAVCVRTAEDLGLTVHVREEYEQSLRAERTDPPRDGDHPTIPQMRQVSNPAMRIPEPFWTHVSNPGTINSGDSVFPFFRFLSSGHMGAALSTRQGRPCRLVIKDDCTCQLLHESTVSKCGEAAQVAATVMKDNRGVGSFWIALYDTEPESPKWAPGSLGRRIRTHEELNKLVDMVRSS